MNPIKFPTCPEQRKDRRIHAPEPDGSDKKTAEQKISLSAQNWSG